MSNSDEVVALDDDDDEINSRHEGKTDSEDDSEDNYSNDSGDDDESDELDEDIEEEDDDDRHPEDESDEMEIEDVEDVLIDSDSNTGKIETKKQVNGVENIDGKDSSQASSQDYVASTPKVRNADPLEVMDVDAAKTPVKSAPNQTESTSVKTVPPRYDPDETIAEAEKTLEAFRNKRPRPVSPELPPSPIKSVLDVESKNILSTAKYDVRVSSVLNKAVKQCGKMFMFDGKEETHWSSDQGSMQFVSIYFKEPQKINSFKVQFQGGFAAREIRLVTEISGTDQGYSESFYPKDSIQMQSFKLKQPIENVMSALFIMEDSNDFFGRITIYHLEVYD